MASIFDRIQQIGAGGSQTSQAGVEQLLKAKTGKAGASTGPKASTGGAQFATAVGQQGIKEQTFADRLQGVQMGAKEKALAEGQTLEQQRLKQQQQMKEQELASQAALTRQNIQAGEQESRMQRDAGQKSSINKLNSEAERVLRDLASSKNIKLDNLFSEFEFSNMELEDRKDASQLEQRAFVLAMQDKQYLEELERIGIERQLTNQIKWQEEFTRIGLGNQLSNIMSDLEFKTDMNATRREQQADLAKINIDVAMQIAQAAIQDDQIRSQWEAGGQVAGAVTSDLSSEDSAIKNYFSDTPDASTPSGQTATS